MESWGEVKSGVLAFLPQFSVTELSVVDDSHNYFYNVDHSKWITYPLSQYKGLLIFVFFIPYAGKRICYFIS